MLVLGLITCIVLRALSAQAKVVDSFEECKEFFYRGIEPSGMDQNAKKICQMLENEEFDCTSLHSPVHYATLYSVHHKIPLYSAYRVDPYYAFDTGRSNIWHLEPQLSQRESEPNHMVSEDRNNQDLYKESQAISSDYIDSGYDRGHLNPSSSQCGDGRKATFTLTNTAPMDVCFNRNHWKNWESTLRSYLVENLVRDNGSAAIFIVTGTVPDPNVRIPQDRKRVTVPSHIWTAVCYKHASDDTKSLSFGFIGKNQPAEPNIHLMSVSELNRELNRLYRESIGSIERNQLERLGIFSETFIWRDYELRPHFWTDQSIKIFVDDCFGDNNKLSKVKEVFQDLINLPVNQAVQMSSDMQNTYQAVNRAVRSDSISIYNNNNVRVSEMTVKLAFDSMSTYYNVAEDLKIYAGSACLITDAKPLMHDELRKMEVSTGSDAVECLLVSEKQNTSTDGLRCSSVTESDDSCQCNTGGETKPCCSSPCLYQDDLKTYRCYSDQKLIECSPRYSLITHRGQRCLDDHPCATYGYDYYWCKITTNSWDYCSPPLRNSKAKNGQYCRSNHACAKYVSTHTWCYTDDKNNYDKCCTSDDCYSAVNGQTCRSDHPCGYYGEKYLWCYTDDQDNWDYCCTNCG